MSTVDDDIRRLLRRINDLERDIDLQRAAKGRAERERLKYERRIGDVEAVANKLSRTFDDEVGDIRSYQSQLKEKISVATAGFSHESLLTASINEDFEKHTEGDTYGSQIHENLRQEISRCRRAAEDAAADERLCSSRIDSYQSQRRSLVSQAKRLAEQPDATVKVWEGYWY